MKIGTMLPSNVIVRDLDGGRIEVAAIEPAVSMEHVGNPTLETIAAPSLASSGASSPQRVIATI
ncbi:hypothetical protein [Reyranella sp.]|uniref:hypothetical protein n=1 Tax=Reyranella sp. TaxID=1929291 RepID=UPI0027318159|nr:hypothetical protein [Reyranella sp.]MDP2377233.1 hypothetical protein [Reyranella sp.]